jgi:hypothetical protein
MLLKINKNLIMTKLEKLLKKIDGDITDLKLFILGLSVSTILLLTLLKEFNVYQSLFILYVFRVLKPIHS